MPDFPIVDTHLHLWDPKRLRYPWLAEVPKIAGPHLIEDYRAACGSVAVAKMVFVQCECDPKQYVDELNWVTQVARADPRIEGAVPWAPLEKGDAARDELECLIDNRIVKGVRRIIQNEPDADAFVRQPDFIRGVQMLAEYELSFDICMGHAQMEAAIELVSRCPDTFFILDHIGKPDIKHRIMEPWANHLKTIAGFPNVVCKISGLVTEADWEHWTPQDLRPYIDHTITCFGFERVLYGGDWPVAALATTYPQWVEALEWVVASASESEHRKLFRDNAIDFYRLQPDNTSVSCTSDRLSTENSRGIVSRSEDSLNP